MNIGLIWDNSDCTLTLNGLTIVAVPRDYPPFTCQAVVQEQDTLLILGEQTEIADPGKPAWYLANTLERSPIHDRGSVVVQGLAPLRLMAVVHDVEREPSCDTGTVQQAYHAVLKVVDDKNITSLALPLLGTVHGKLTVQESMQLLRDALQANQPVCLQQLWLIPPDGGNCNCLAMLSSQ
jgi:hypothetical protein